MELLTQHSPDLGVKECGPETIIIPGVPPAVGDNTALVSVLHLINGEHYSGAERVQDLLAGGLPEFGYQVHFACLKPDKFLARRHHRSVGATELPMANNFDLRVLGRLTALVQRLGVRVLHAHTPRTAMVGSLLSRMTHIPWVYHVHSPTVNDSQRIWQNRMNAWVERVCLWNVKRLITVSRSLSLHMTAKGFPASQIHVVANGVPASDRLSSRPTPGPRWTLGTVALFRPRKGTEVLLEAMALLREKGQDVRLRAVGPFETPEYERHVKAIVTQYRLDDAVEWLGFCADVSAEMEPMDLFVLPSLFGEGMPMVVLEAMANGVPVVASRVEGTPEAVRDGIDGVLCQPQSARDLATAIERVIRHQGVHWQTLRQSAFARQHAEFSTQSMARGVAEVYNDVLAPHGP